MTFVRTDDTKVNPVTELTAGTGATVLVEAPTLVSMTTTPLSVALLPTDQIAALPVVMQVSLENAPLSLSTDAGLITVEMITDPLDVKVSCP